MSKSDKLAEIQADQDRSSWLRRHLDVRPEDKDVRTIQDFLAGPGAVPLTIVFGLMALVALFFLLAPVLFNVFSSVFPR